jgi:hypothetical protein
MLTDHCEALNRRRAQTVERLQALQSFRRGTPNATLPPVR